MQCVVCQETGHLGPLILPVSKDYFSPSKHKETEGTVEDGTGTNGRTKDPFLLCFLSSSQSLVDCKLETFPFCMVISWPGC